MSGASVGTLMGMMYLNAIGVEHDYENAVEWFRKGAESGNEDAAIPDGKSNTQSKS